MRINYILLFLLLFNGAIPYVNSLNMFTYQTQNYSAFSTPVIISGAQCSVNPNNGSSICTPSLSSGAALSSLLVFGDFFGGMLSFIATTSMGIILPGYFLLEWGVSVQIAALFTAGMWFAYFLALITFRSGRYTED